MVALGRFAFRYRNLLFPLIVLAALAVSTPQDPFGSDAYDAWMDVAGAVAVLAGLAVRALTIGYDAVLRDGRAKQVYADRLVTGGVYAHVRNPLYLGNLLVVLGFALVFNAPLFYALVLPAMGLLFASIIAAEEAYLRDRFGAEYEAYCARVPRLVPRLRGFRRSVEGMRFRWRRVLVKEYTSQFVGVVSLIILDWWHDGLIRGDLVSWSPEHLAMAAFLAVWVVLFVIVWRLKKSGRLTADAPDLPHSA